MGIRLPGLLSLTRPCFPEQKQAIENEGAHPLEETASQSFSTIRSMIYQNLHDIESTLLDNNDVPARDLHAIWEQRLPISDPSLRKPEAPTSDALQIAWLQADISLARSFIKHALKKEEFLLACDAAEETLRLTPSTNREASGVLVDVRMDYATALTRLGCTQKARGWLEPCLHEHSGLPLGRKRKVDILLQIGDILREESHHTAATAARRQKNEDALHFYKQALEIEPERLEALYLTAAVSLILSERGSQVRDQAHDYARQALRRISHIEDASGRQTRTVQANAIAHAVLGDTDLAAKHYGEMKSCEGVSVAELANARYEARFLAEALGLGNDFFKTAFPPLPLVVFAGHLPDLPGGRMRFPFDAVESVREQLRTELQKMDARVGFVSAAAGADLLFIEALRERGGTVHLLLPWSKDEFRRTSVRPYEPAGQSAFWEEKYDRALKEAATVREIGQNYEPGSDVSWQYLVEVTAGLALDTARISRLDVKPLALWDGRPGLGVGGTDSFVDFWQRHLGQEPVVISLPAPPAPSPVAGDTAGYRSRRCERSTLRQEVKSMLFADIVGYSKLSELVIPEFVGLFLERVSQIAASSRHSPRYINTWGDAVYAVFDFAHDAGCFALELTQMIQEGEESWTKAGLYWEEPLEGAKEPKKHPLNIRVGLHTGPVFMHYNPVVRQLGFTGVHVNRAARIEPVTAHGEVFASEEFAAFSALRTEIRRQGISSGAPPENSQGFVCEYAGSMPLAKGYPGRFRIYRVLPKRVLAVEELARAVHRYYCIEAEAKGDTLATNSSLEPWERLPEDLREANMAQAADIPNKLRALGFELAPGPGLSPFEMHMSDAQAEDLAIREHNRWMGERERLGWTYGSVRDNARKRHPLLVRWEQLCDSDKEKDRDAVRNLPKLIETARFRVRKIAGMK